jgi:hypothetical protein
MVNGDSWWLGFTVCGRSSHLGANFFDWVCERFTSGTDSSDTNLLLVAGVTPWQPPPALGNAEFATRRRRRIFHCNAKVERKLMRMLTVINALQICLVDFPGYP